ncbi:hypothetical protein [Alteromonas sp. KUL49]|uniref:hypothetical protein n=1 Tax=Alteromonas sp. KUL49 TaxID=2480798 RepID=UPI00102EE6CB|nr:hypothetical protein [Alteromonas sp. KUL49]TAP36859.1 hypothetical protein EYS00_17220 [Alteromonas sp. KUL49]GEA13122.1 hypothetical protein KUL49_34970 [Alteromonas sp. KUL49]
MPAPDFNSKSIDILAKRASFRCSNPDCRTLTFAPNSESDKATVIGEAAHIHGARPKSKRYCVDMTDHDRAEITNGIWLCRNCHKLIDTDEKRYSAELLFAWREKHERFVLSELGNSSDKLLSEQQELLLSAFAHYPPIVRRLIIDKPTAWEFHLAAELLRHLNASHFRKIRDLRDGLYIGKTDYVDDDEIIGWVEHRLHDASNIGLPAEKLLSKLTQSFGEQGIAGDVEEIHHACLLLRDYISKVANYEEILYFSKVPDQAENILELLKDTVSSQVEKLEQIPDYLDEIVSILQKEHSGTVDDPVVIQKTIVFELPRNWGKKMNREIAKLSRSYSGSRNNGWMVIAIFFVTILLLSIL